MDFINSVDSGILLFIQENIRNSILTPIMMFITRLGDAGFIFILSAILLLCFKKTRKTGVLFAFSLIINLVICNLIIKPLVGRIRPFNVIDELELMVKPLMDYSFPSGHTSAAFACSFALMYDKKKWFYTSLIFAVIMGFSRLYVGIHYPTDVISGAVIGVLCAIAAHFILEKIKKNKKNKI